MKEEIVFKPLNYSEDELVQIVGLIRSSLDPEFTTDFFKWKHLENPFGKSYGLVAWSGDKIIGLRVFMFWEFIQENKKVLRSIRPVDTVVDSNFRGRGLFKKLTLQGLENCKGQYNFIFNTPNNNSLPGYLKMGWEKSKTVSNFRIGLINPFHLKPKLIKTDLETSPIFSHFGKNLETNKSLEYLRWRYVNSKYKIYSYEKGTIVFSLTRIKGIRGFIVYELLGNEKHFNDLLLTVAKEYNAYLVYYYNSKDLNNLRLLTSFDRKEAVVVLKENQSVSMENINFSLGDLEGKL
ncbi:MAG: GNAT family N-acetyltransferase [Candidatus Bathyarchaeota archaeon]|nr:GNAT family N-acetyltransferase [Candidatus Bathyarchaeota archaeon]